MADGFAAAAAALPIPIGPALLMLVAGAALGAAFYAGLWWTVRRAASFRRPALAVLTSLLLRVGVAVGGIYLVAGRDALRIALCLLGFVAARAAAVRIVAPRPTGRAAPGVGDAP